MRFSHPLAMAALSCLVACSSQSASPTPTAESQAWAPLALLHGDHEEHEHHALFARDLAQLRQATARFHSIPAAEAEGYAAFGGCFADSTLGGMGYHWANAGLMADSAIDANRPELLVYQSTPEGGKRLVAVEYLVFVDEWQAKGHQGPPSLFGQDFHINPTLLAKPFYLLHAWVWKPNPSGILNDWNPRVHCP